MAKKSKAVLPPPPCNESEIDDVSEIEQDEKSTYILTKNTKEPR
jgi:hypothetical protein